MTDEMAMATSGRYCSNGANGWLKSCILPSAASNYEAESDVWVFLEETIVDR